MSDQMPGPAPGTDAQDVTEEPDTRPSAQPRPDRPPAGGGSDADADDAQRPDPDSNDIAAWSPDDPETV